MEKYRKVKHDGRIVREHRAIMENFLGRRLSSDEIIHHIDGNPRNNNIENLSIVSRAEHQKIHGLSSYGAGFKKGGHPGCEFKKGREGARGESAWNSKLTERDVDKIRELLSAGIIQKEIAKQFGVSKATIWSIKKGIRWAYYKSPESVGH